jgi:hypothetical protein
MADLEDYFVEDSDQAALWHWLLVLKVEREEDQQKKGELNQSRLQDSPDSVRNASS